MKLKLCKEGPNGWMSLHPHLKKKVNEKEPKCFWIKSDSLKKIKRINFFKHK